ncbi:conserved hypothetical protein [Sphingomonas sp. T1]|nr:conserved hypothetical protein [Sphingomonas sp. T1]
MARVTGLEPATSGVTGRRSNQLSYTRIPNDDLCTLPANGCGGRHRRRHYLTPSTNDGASDGTRTRDLRRDRPAL